MTRLSTAILLSLVALLTLFCCFHENVPFIGLAIPHLSRSSADDLYEQWHECMARDMEFLSSSSEQIFWVELEKPVQRCETTTAMKELPMEGFTNYDETKYSILPIEENTGSTIVTIGVGQDVHAELLLQQTLGNYSVQFFGADPIVEGNDELYSAFGKFFPFAVGNSSRMGTASVLLNGQYVNKRVIHVELVQFLKDIVGRSFIDNIWLDGEYAEYELFDYFTNGGRLDQNGIAVCQFNMEFHLPTLAQKQQFQNFIEKIFEDRRYAFFRPVRGSHIRLFFVNFKDPNCVRKYISA